MIVLDIDGVIANPFDEINYRLAKLGYPTRPTHEVTESYHWRDIHPEVPTDVLREIVSDPLTIKNAMVYEDSWYWVNHMSSTYDMMFLTARPKEVTEYTWAWFFDWDLPADFVVFEKNKVEFLDTIRDSVYVYVDDYPEMIDQAVEIGLNAYLMDRPYNQNYDKELPRISSLWEIKL